MIDRKKSYRMVWSAGERLVTVVLYERAMTLLCAGNGPGALQLIEQARRTDAARLAGLRRLRCSLRRSG